MRLLWSWPCPAMDLHFLQPTGVKGAAAADEFQEALSGLGLRVDAREALAEEFSPSKVPPCLGLCSMCWPLVALLPDQCGRSHDTHDACAVCCRRQVWGIHTAPLSLDDGYSPEEEAAHAAHACACGQAGSSA